MNIEHRIARREDVPALEALIPISERAAIAAGIRSIEIIATLAGEPFHVACGYVTTERYSIELANGLNLPVVRMEQKNPEATTYRQRDCGRSEAR